MSTKFTPGPWFLRVDEDGDEFIAAPVDGNADHVEPWWIAQAIDMDDQTEANAQLIAAAPDLYAHVETLAQAMKDHLGNPATETGWVSEEVAEAYVAAQRALAKARGEA